MTALEVGNKLVELCRARKNLEAIDRLYDKSIVSTEPMGMPGHDARQQGIEAIRGKNKWWLDTHEIHSHKIEGPFPHGDRFIVHMFYDVTPNSGPYAGKRMQIEEAGLYTVKNGRIVEEEFFYHMDK